MYLLPSLSVYLSGLAYACPALRPSSALFCLFLSYQDLLCLLFIRQFPASSVRFRRMTVRPCKSDDKIKMRQKPETSGRCINISLRPVSATRQMPVGILFSWFCRIFMVRLSPSFRILHIFKHYFRNTSICRESPVLLKNKS